MRQSPQWFLFFVRGRIGLHFNQPRLLNSTEDEYRASWHPIKDLKDHMSCMAYWSKIHQQQQLCTFWRLSNKSLFSETIVGTSCHLSDTQESCSFGWLWWIFIVMFIGQVCGVAWLHRSPGCCHSKTVLWVMKPQPREERKREGGKTDGYEGPEYA